jgi:HD-like signal output (HDOD) protein
MLPPPRALSTGDTLRALVRRGDLHLPAVPVVIAKLQELLRDEDRADAHRVAAVITTEPAIAASTLRLANSIAFGGLRPVFELSEAVGRIGFREVANLATTVSLRGAFRSASVSRSARLVRMSHQALVAAVFARTVPYGACEPEEAYLAGLLHDIGRPLVLKLLDVVEGKRIEPLSEEAVDALLDELHVELGHSLLVSWHIPEPVCEVTRRHHDASVPDEAALLLRIQAADAFARACVGTVGANGKCPFKEAPEVVRLGLPDEVLDQVRIDVEDRVTLLRCFL